MSLASKAWSWDNPKVPSTSFWEGRQDWLSGIAWRSLEKGKTLDDALATLTKSASFIDGDDDVFRGHWNLINKLYSVLICSSCEKHSLKRAESKATLCGPCNTIRILSPKKRKRD